MLTALLCVLTALVTLLVTTHLYNTKIRKIYAAHNRELEKTRSQAFKDGWDRGHQYKCWDPKSCTVCSATE